MNWTLQIGGENQTFKDKQKDLFAELDKVKTALPHEKYVDQKEKSERDTNKKFPMKTYKGKNSIFKRPEAPLRKCLPRRRRPDYQVNPQRWTKYSLNDVTEEDMSESANKNAALSFLKDLEKRKEDEEAQRECISFKNSAMITATENDEQKSSTFQSSKRIMPEYVIGQKIKKEKKHFKRAGTTKNNELALSHLTEDNSEEENT